MEIKIACGTGLKEDYQKVYDYLTSCEKWPSVDDVAASTGLNERSVYYAMRRIAFQTQMNEARGGFLSQGREDKEKT